MEARITERSHPMIGVIVGVVVIHGIFRSATSSHIDGCNATVQEGGIITSAAKDAYFATLMGPDIVHSEAGIVAVGVYNLLHQVCGDGVEIGSRCNIWYL